MKNFELQSEDTSQPESHTIQGADAGRLADLIKQIHEAEKQASAMDKVCRDSGRTAVAIAIKAGGLLLECKKLIGHGKWDAWRSKNFPNISQETACRWMRMSNLSGVTDFAQAASLTEAYRMCSEKKAKAAILSAPQTVLRASTTLQKQMRLMVQKKYKATETDKIQLRLVFSELSDLFKKIIGDSK